ncbi:hypothetical protein CEP54_014789 [Fusarium duplospermum]|uniref:Uncharacterized protein n=1 Tax=Fusarium duplospermum TaxID=1325734 RepID=A0A428NTU7_9HYPO|nr:hypothetical protein CEP54_014789 [Fusarium duplospermum]
MSCYSETFEAAFADPKNTAVTTPDADVNAIISKNYTVDEPFTYTKSLLWDMEVKKALGPDKYISHVIRPGSLKVVDHTKEGSLEYFTRITDQRVWKDPDQYTTVIEHICLDHVNQKAFFLGVAEATLPDGTKLTSGERQPLFHVEHCAVGSEENPVNTWRIVHLTEARDEDLVKAFDGMMRDPYLRQFNEVYIREDLGRQLVQKDITT